MARPVKNYCEYFSHDRDMRNHRKIKAVRTKFGITGYGIWCMTLEYLTGIDGNVIEYTETELELMSGDYGVSATEIRDVLDYCVKLELLFIKDGFLHSETLDKRLKTVYDKRGVSKSNSEKQSRTNGKFGNKNTDKPVVSVTEIPQSKVNEIKVNKSIDTTDPPKQLEEVGSEAVVAAAKQAWDDQGWREQICLANYMKPEDMRQWMYAYNASLSNDVIDGFSPGKYKKMFNGWLQSQKQKGRTLPERPKSEVSQLRKIN